LAAATTAIVFGAATPGRKRWDIRYVEPPAIAAANKNAIKVRRKSVNHPQKNFPPRQYRAPMAIAGAKGIRIEPGSLMFSAG
jgi:hypothetical protein